MRIRWRFLLPTIGILFFVLVSYQRCALIGSRSTRRGGISGGVPFVSIPIQLDRQSERSTPCKEGSNCVGWDEIDYKWVEHGWLSQTLMLSAFPAFLVGWIIVVGLREVGISEVASFMVFHASINYCLVLLRRSAARPLD